MLSRRGRLAIRNRCFDTRHRACKAHTPREQVFKGHKRLHELGIGVVNDSKAYRPASVSLKIPKVFGHMSHWGWSRSIRQALQNQGSVEALESVDKTDCESSMP